MPVLRQMPIWILKPQEGLSTPAVYRQLCLDALPKRDPKLHLKAFYENEPALFNDLEEPAFQLQPSLRQLKENLVQQGFEQVILSGSGTAFVCMGQPKESSLTPFQREVQFVCRSPGGWY